MTLGLLGTSKPFDFWTLGLQDFSTSGCLDCSIDRLWDFVDFSTLDFWTLGFIDFGTWDVGTFCLLDFWIFDFSTFGLWGLLDFGTWDFWILGL